MSAPPGTVSPVLPAAPREVTPDRALPPGRVGYDLDAPTLLLHSFLAPAAYDELHDTGRLVARAEHMDFEFYDEVAYAWMAQQVRERLGAAPDQWPLWAWARSTRVELVRSARRYARNDPGTVLVTCHVPRERVLLSSFDDWHMPLNGQPYWPRTLSDEEFEVAFNDWYDRREAVLPGSARLPRAAWPPNLLAQIEATWSGIFDASTWSAREFVQACMGTLFASDVIDAVRLVRASPGQ